MSTPAPSPVYLTLDDAAIRLGVSIKFLRRRISDGELPGYRVGRRAIRVNATDVDALARPIPSVSILRPVAGRSS